MEPGNTSLEKAIPDEITSDEPWKLVEKFSTIVRLSGTDEERKAIDYLISRLDALGIPYAVYEPEIYMSLPLAAEMNIVSEAGETLPCKNPAFSVSGTIEGDLIYVPADLASGIGDFFNTGGSTARVDVRGKIIMTEGISTPRAAKEYEDRGAIAQIYINPHPDTIHELIVTQIWGIPTLENIRSKPRTPIVNTNSTSGERLRELLAKGPVRCRITTRLDEGWKKAMMPVAEITGTEEPEKFILLHGHLDSWHVGVTDNATGNAGELEIARVFNLHRQHLRRSLRVAWWSGHSHGRYAGSTWYADFKGLDIEKNCIAQVNMDSPGVKGATVYDEIMWMAEVDDVCKSSIRDVTGVTPNRLRPIRAGDYSFNNIGVTSFYMLSSNIPADVKRQKGYYAVGGSGGNSDAWHNENDVLEHADPDVLVRDIKLYAATILRVLNSPVYPFDFVKAVDEYRQIVTGYQQAAGDSFDLKPVLNELSALRGELVRFNAAALKAADDREEARRFNEALLRLGRILIPLSYAKREIFEHDPATEVPPFAEIAGAANLTSYDETSDERKFLLNQLMRGRNKVMLRLNQARRLVARFVV